MVTLIVDFVRAVGISVGLMTFVWALAQGWDWLCGYQQPHRDRDA